MQKIQIDFQPKVIFTTAETVLPHQVRFIQDVFNCRVYDQYSSSEGATFIFQCHRGKMHYQLLNGIIEVVDDDMNPANEGEILITSFITKGTPLIRYRIGDSVRLSNEKCDCGDNQPIVAKIEGRKIDFIYSKDRGKINLGNISNCVKNINGVRKFQIIQEELDSINVKIIIDKVHYTNDYELEFKKELIDRLGDSVKINFHYVDEIDKSASGKHRLIINKISHLVK